MSITVPFPPEQPRPVQPQVSTELRVQRRNTLAFIDADPVRLTLVRHEVTQTAGGGRRSEPVPPIPAQKVRLIPANDRTPQIRTASGELETPEFTLLGEYFLNVQKGDRFVYKGTEYLIPTEPRPRHTDEAYEVKADVVVNRDAT